MRALVFLALLISINSVAATPNQMGQTGLINMPDGRLAEDGTVRMGLSRMVPYRALWGSITLLPWLEFSGRYTLIEDTSPFGPDREFGMYKDKAFDLKLRLLEETEWLPAVSFGVQDFHGTALFRGQFIAASKRVALDDYGAFDMTLGYGRTRMDGLYGGVRWHTPWDDRFRVAVEWDAIDYENDTHFRRTGLLRRDGGLTPALEYSGDLFSAQIALQDGRVGANVSLKFPLEQRTFAPKTREPAHVEVPAYERLQETPTAALRPMFDALTREGMSDVRVSIRGDTLHASVSSSRYSTIGRAIGRASRVIALGAPPDVTKLEITYAEYRLPVATYRFADLDAYRGWLNGTTTPEAFQQTLSLSYANNEDWRELHMDGLKLRDLTDDSDSDAYSVRVGPWIYGFPVSVRRNAENSSALRIQPLVMGFMFNDPNGAFRYDLHTAVTYSQWLGNGFYFATSGRLTLAEDVSESIGGSNSLLPRVRSNVARYRRESERLKMHTAFVGHLGNPRERVYTWASAGVLEEMFAGAGGEVLYLPQTGNWAVDFSAYAVRQRDFKGWFGFQDYDTVTALTSFYYRVPKHGLTFTTRVGRFLARDIGARFEVKRRFKSGVEFGAWYSRTNANDITGPGSPGDPYFDKGIFVRVAVGPFLPYDSNASLSTSLSPWARDPGAVLQAPGGLYDLFERRLLLNLEDLGPWSDFGQ